MRLLERIQKRKRRVLREMSPFAVDANRFPT
jgi:hypothetical protein